MAQIAIIGAGNVGANSAFFIAERNIGGVVMYDIQEGLATGKALDMMEAAPIRGYQHGIRGTDRFGDVLETDVVVMAAGTGRVPGIKREDLFVKNIELIDQLASDLSGYKGTVILATEPVDLMVMRFQEKSGLPASRVLGLGGALDSTRLRFFLGRALGITTENISATVIGRHSDEMIVPLEYCRVSGVPVSHLMEQGDLEAVINETRTAGDVIVEMSQRASSFYGPSAVAADVVEGVIRDTGRVLPVSFVWDGGGHYGISGVAMSLPAVLGFAGISRAMEPVLQENQIATLRSSADELRRIYGSV